MIELELKIYPKILFADLPFHDFNDTDVNQAAFDFGGVNKLFFGLGKSS